MRNTGWKIIILILIMYLIGTTAFANGLGGWINMVGSISKTYEEGEKVASTESYTRNYYLKFNKAITPMLFYQINLRANLQDTDVTDENNNVTQSYRRRLEPAVDLSLRNTMYDVGLGFRRQEEWSGPDQNELFRTGSVFRYALYPLTPFEWTNPDLLDRDRETSDFFYARFGFTPKALPTFSIHLDRQEDSDYTGTDGDDLSLRTVRTNEAYSISSSYELPSRDLRFRYNVNFSHNDEKTPLRSTEKSINDNFNGNYNVGYYGKYWGGKGYYAVNYQGNYAKNKNQQFLTETGNFLNERTLLGGFHGKGTTLEPEVDTLAPKGDLIVDETVATNINIGNDDLINNRFHNMGVLVSFQKSVDRLYVYVNKDVSGDSSLTNTANWRIFKSNANQGDAWQEISLENQTITITPIDVFGNIYRYELVFSSEHEESFFKVINMRTADVPNVAVTKIEAWGTDTVTDTHTTSVSSSFTQGIDLNTNIRLMPKLNLTLNYSLNRTDQNPVSVYSSIWGVFNNVYSNSISGEEDDFKSNITRNYGLTSTWLTHRLLTTTLRLQRNENFDNLDQTNTYSNSYHLSFNSAPLATLDATISLIRSDRYSFNEKDSTNSTALLSVGSRLYRDVNMITDLGYTETESFQNDTETSSYSLNGSLDALITKKLSGTLNYAYASTETDGGNSVAKEVLTSINYQPGRFINLSGNVSAADSSGDRTVSAGVLADWLPLPSVRLNMNYQYTKSDPGPSRSDSVGGYGIWYVTRFADLRFSYGYTRTREEIKTETHNASVNLNCRF